MNAILLLSLALLSDNEISPARERRERRDDHAGPLVRFVVVRRKTVLPEPPAWLESFLPPRLRLAIRETEDTRESIGVMIRGPIPLPHVWLQHERYLGRGFALRVGVGLGGLRPSLPVEVVWYATEESAHSVGIDLARMTWLRGHTTSF